MAYQHNVSLSDETKEFLRLLLTDVCQYKQTQEKLDKIMAQIDDLGAAITELKSAADDAKARDQKIIDALTAIQNNPPAGPDLTAAIQAVKDIIPVEQSIGNLPAAPSAS